MWVSIKRNYHGDEPPHDTRWVIAQAGDTRGICECYTEPEADKVTNALNAWDDRDV